MSAAARRLEVAGFAALVLAAWAALAWRWAGQDHGLAADQAESLVLARGLVEGRGLKLTAASAFSAGPANLAWLGVQALVLRAGQAPETWLPRLSLALLALALLVVALRGALVWRRAPRVEDALPVLGLAFATATAEAAALGSGAMGWIGALAVVAVLTGRGLSSGHSGWAAIGVGLLCVFRPAAAWFIAASVPAWWLAARLEGRRAGWEALRFLGTAVFVAALVIGFRAVVLGALPPDGLMPSDEGVAGTLEFVARQSRWFWAAGAGVLVAGVWRRFQLRGGGTLVAWVLMTLVLSSWSASARSLFLGCVPLLAMLVGDGLSAAREGLEREARETPLRALSWAALLSLVTSLALASASSWALGPIMKQQVVPVRSAEVDAELTRRGLRQPLVAWTDGAEAAAMFPAARVVVVPRADPLLEDLLVSEGPPDVVDARVPLAEMARLAGRLGAGAGGLQWLSEQSPDEDPRCPDGRLALLSTSPEQLLAQLAADVAAEQPARALSRWRCALAALDEAQLPAPAQRAVVAASARSQSEVFERQGRLELAVRAASLAASLRGEDVQERSRAERLRARWLERR